MKQVRKEFAKVKNEELVNITVIHFTYQDFILGFCQKHKTYLRHFIIPIQPKQTQKN
jgi:hypothetical protein